MTTTVRARWQLAAGGGAALALVLALPGPPAAVRSLEDAVAGGTAVVDAAAMVVASVAGWCVVGWGLSVLAIAVLARVPGAVGRGGGAVLRRVAPAAVRHVLIAGTGLSMLAGATACASDPGPVDDRGLPGPPAPVSAAQALTDREAGLDHGIGDPVSGPESGSDHGPAAARDTAVAPNLDWPVIGPTSSPDLDWPESPPPDQDPSAGRPGSKSTPRPGPAAEPVVVLAGDTLWSIAAERLGPGADDGEIDAAWRAWYAANRQVIGDDPDLILPGQRLRPPDSFAAAAASPPALSPSAGAAGSQNGENR